MGSALNQETHLRLFPETELDEKRLNSLYEWVSIKY